MDDEKKTIGPEDYADPRCPLCERGFGEEPVNLIPQQRISEKLDEYMGKGDFAGAERHLKYWLNEAIVSGDRRGEFMIYNEMMGYYRMTGRQEEAFEAADNALSMLDELGYGDSVSGGTCFINAGTVYNAFGVPERGLPMFEKAKEIYESKLPASHPKLGGLYNNYALSLTAVGRYGEGREIFEKALNVMSTLAGTELEQAITYMNMADARGFEEGEEKAKDYIDSCLEKARELLNSENLERNSYYRYVCENCIPGFEHYGWRAYADKLRERIAGI